MSELLIGAALGKRVSILASLSVRPAAKNIAGISFVSSRLARPRRVFLAGRLCTLGRSITYVQPGVLLVPSVLSAPEILRFLRKYMDRMLGPLLRVVAVFLLELLTVQFPAGGASQKILKRAETRGVLGQALLRILFALTFCRASGALFSGSLTRSAIRCKSGNSCRSHIPEDWVGHLKGYLTEPCSVAVEASALDPRAVAVMKEAGVEVSAQPSKAVQEIVHIEFDYVVTLCGHARETCPVFPGKAEVIHRGFDDPPRLAESAKSEEEVLQYYRRVRDEIRAFVEKLPDALETWDTKEDA